MSIRVVLSTIVEDGEQEAFEEAYRQVADRMRGIPGHVQEELLYDSESRRYSIFAEWTSREAFLAWVEDPAHTKGTGPLIPYLDRDFERRLLQISARSNGRSNVRERRVEDAVA